MSVVHIKALILNPNLYFDRRGGNNMRERISVRYVTLSGENENSSWIVK